MAGVPIFSESPISPAAQRAGFQAPTPHSFQESSEVGLSAADGRLEQERAQVAIIGAPRLAAAAAKPRAMEFRPFEPEGQAIGLSIGRSAPGSRATSPARTLPPPPKTGEALRPTSYYAITPDSTSGSFHASRSATASPAEAAHHPYPHHTIRNNLLSPTSPYDSALQTPKSAPLPRKSLEHPPGYVQNPYAADLTPEQRFATQHGPASPTLGYGNTGGDSAGGILGAKSPSSVFNFGALLSPASGREAPLSGGAMDSGEDLWSVVGGWVKGVGKKVGEVESEVWKRINGGNE